MRLVEIRSLFRSNVIFRTHPFKMLRKIRITRIRY